MTKASVLIGIIGSIIAIYIAVIPVPQYFERLSGRVSQLEEQVHSLTPTVTTADRLNGRVSQLEEQMRSFTASSSSTVAANDRLDGRISQLEEKVRSLAAASAATAAITEVNRKPATAVDPVLQKCVELAEEANTGQRDNAMGFTSGPEVTKNALMSMDKFGCNSIGH